MGACLFGEKVKNVFTAGTHGSTFGGNPIACAGGNAVLDKIMSEGFLDDVNRKAEHFRKRLEKSPEVVSVSGIGLMIGIELKNKKASDVAAKAIEKGLLVLTAKSKVRLLPPLNIEMSEIDSGLDILIDILEG